MRIAITCNIKDGVPPHLEEDYAEWDEPETIESIRAALMKTHEEVFIVRADRHAPARLAELNPQMVFNIAEGSGGECRESLIPAVLELLNIPYTGSSPLTLGLCLNKVRTKQVLAFHNIPTPRFFLAEDSHTLEEAKDIGFPLIVKPLHEGSSKGIRDDSVVKNPEELKARIEYILSRHNQPALVEEYLEGREFTVALLGNGRELEALPIVEIDYSALPAGANPIYSYEAKWVFDCPDSPLELFLCPAPIEDGLRAKVVGLAMDAFRALGVRDWCRIDIRCDNSGNPYVLELNPLPGILPNPEQNSCFPKAARAAGMSFEELVNRLVDIAKKRYALCG